jgi:hypothetical protein
MKYKLIAAAFLLASLPALAAEPSGSFEVSYAPGTRDVSGRPMGGTEIRNLVAHDGRLFAANGFWKDTSPPTDTPGPQILVLDTPGAAWRIDHEFDERLPRGRRRHLAISALSEVTFRTDSGGAPLGAPISELLASTWDINGRRTVLARDRSGLWTGVILAQDAPSPGFLPQIRSFGFHRDRRTGVDRVFAGDTTGIFSGAFDKSVPAQIAWTSTPELATSGLAADAFPGLSGRLRISSFAEAGGRLFAAVGQQVWVREDGPTPRWQKFYTNPSPHYSQTGLRGLTSVTDPGKHEFLLAAVEGNASRIVRIDPVTAAETTDLDLSHLLDTSWGTRVSYVIAAYNDMARLPRGSARDDLLIGLEAFIPPPSPRPPGHTVLDVIHGLEGGGWFLIRHPGGEYELRQVTARFPATGLNLVAVRTLAVSPFPGEANVVYVGGYDANETPAHDTGWIARGIIQPTR